MKKERYGKSEKRRTGRKRTVLNKKRRVGEK
jgi:hypothetical protein